MAVIGTILALLALGVFLWAVVGLIRPELARLSNRASSVGVWVLSVVLLGDYRHCLTRYPLAKRAVLD
jgi:sulfite exporter TauE/SafE